MERRNASTLSLVERSICLSIAFLCLYRRASIISCSSCSSVRGVCDGDCSIKLLLIIHFYYRVIFDIIFVWVTTFISSCQYRINILIPKTLKVKSQCGSYISFWKWHSKSGSLSNTSFVFHVKSDWLMYLTHSSLHNFLYSTEYSALSFK